jgi:hypothetical protein
LAIFDAACSGRFFKASADIAALPARFEKGAARIFGCAA